MKSDRVFIGIDPGKSGAVAILKGMSDSATIIRFAANDGHSAISELKNIMYWDYDRAPIAVLEHVHSMPKQGVASTFSFGENFGWWRGVLEALGIAYELVRPQVWKKNMGCNSDKTTSIQVAQRLFPKVNLAISDRATKPNDGMAEALLIAEYARRKYGQKIY